MIARVRRFIFGFSLAGGLLYGAKLDAPVVGRAQGGCDPNYTPVAAGCVPSDRDYDCPELHAMGLGDIPVIGTDWQRRDGLYDYERGEWVSYPDRLGCEWYGE
jgi:hypothetical protein